MGEYNAYTDMRKRQYVSLLQIISVLVLQCDGFNLFEEMGGTALLFSVFTLPNIPEKIFQLSLYVFLEIVFIENGNAHLSHLIRGMMELDQIEGGATIKRKFLSSIYSMLNEERANSIREKDFYLQGGLEALYQILNTEHEEQIIFLALDILGLLVRSSFGNKVYLLNHIGLLDLLNALLESKIEITTDIFFLFLRAGSVGKLDSFHPITRLSEPHILAWNWSKIANQIRKITRPEPLFTKMLPKRLRSSSRPSSTHTINSPS